MTTTADTMRETREVALRRPGAPDPEPVDPWRLRGPQSVLLADRATHVAQEEVMPHV